MGVLPGPHSHSKVMHLDLLEAGWTVWVNIGSCLSCLSLLWVSEVLACHVIVLAFRSEGVFIPVIGSHPGISHS